MRWSGPILSLALLFASVPERALAYDPDALRYGLSHDAIFGVGPVHSAGHLELTTGLWFATAGTTLRKQTSVGEVDMAGASVRGAVTAGLSIFERARLGLVLPLVFHQTGEALDGAEIDGSGLADPRIVAQVAIHGDARKGLQVGGGLETTLPVGDAVAWTGDGEAGVALHLNGEYLAGPMAAVTRLGYRIRSAEQVLDLSVGDAIEWSAGFRYDVQPAVRLESLLMVSTLASDPFAGGATPMELLVGVKHRFHPCYSASIGGGGPINAGVGAAAWRGLVGVIYACRTGRAAVRKPPESAADRRKRVRQRRAREGKGDKDGDGIPDSRDWCPAEAEDKDQHQDEDGCPEPDNDGDGVEDVDDNCPSMPEDLDRFQDGDGCPDTDNDGDGVPDVRDACPDVKETFDGVDDGDGCPEVADTQSFQVAAGFVMPPFAIEFAPGEAVLSETALAGLPRLAQYLIRRGEIALIEVQGHTHSEGDDAVNRTLSAARAQAVVAKLVALGVASSRLRATGFGETMPLESNATAAGRQANERIDFRIVKGPGAGGGL